MNNYFLSAIRVTGEMINEGYLSRLGKINIICGKNNSGKSTLLNNISKGLFKRELVISTEIIEGFINKLKDLKSFNYSEHDKFNQQLLDLLNTELLLGIDLDALQEDLLNSIQNKVYPSEVDLGELNNISQDYSMNPRIIRLFLDRHVAIQIPTSEIPIVSPQRQLPLKSPLTEITEPSYNGANIINYLFNFKNQGKQSPSWDLYQSITNNFSQISGAYDFDVILSGHSSITLQFFYGKNILADTEYSAVGLKNLLVLTFFALFPGGPIIIIEEPETHLHPELQRRFLDFLKNKTDKQYFISTHSNVFLDTTYIDSVFLTQYSEHITITNATSRSMILNELGYTIADNLVSDLILLTEGPSDIPVIQHFLEELGLYGRYNIKAWPLGGDIMNQVDLSVFTQSHKIIALIDNDPGSRTIREKFIAKCEEHSISHHRLQRYSIENYFTVDAIRRVFKGQVPESFNEMDPDTRLSDQIRFDVKKKNWNIAREMTLEDIKGTDLYEFLLKVETLLKL